MNWGFRWLVPTVVFLFAGCQSMPPVVGPEPVDDIRAAWRARQAELHAVQDWSLTGRIAVSALGRGYNGTLRWDQSGEVFTMTVVAPLGAGSVSVEGVPEWVVIRASDGTEFATAYADEELARWLAAPLPVASLRWWILGMPDPMHPIAAELDLGGRASAFDQRGWRVSFPRYTQHDGVVVPGMVVAERDGSRLRVIVDGWHAVQPDDG